MPATNSAPPDHYGVLNLPNPATHASVKLSNAIIKQAYHATLLRHHPDKASLGSSSPGLSSGTGASSPISIDAITEAYRTLADPKLRAAYDWVLRLTRAGAGVSATPGQRSAAHIVGAADGLRVLDLDELDYDESIETWWHACSRCGSARGIEVAAADLEDAAAGDGDVADREILVGCSGCSLWTRITFQLAPPEEGASRQGDGGGDAVGKVMDGELQL